MRPLLSPFLLLLALPARADRITLSNGNVVEGKAEVRGDLVHVSLRRGWVDLPKDAVARIEPGQTSWEAYASKASGLKEGDAKGHAALAAWCGAGGLPDEALEQWRLVLKADPAHAEAKRAVGEAEARDRTERESREARHAEVLRLFAPLPAEDSAEEARPVESWPRTFPRPLARGASGSLPLWEGSLGPWVWFPDVYPSVALPSPPCAGGLSLRYSTSFAGGRGRLVIRLGNP